MRATATTTDAARGLHGADATAFAQSLYALRCELPSPTPAATDGVARYLPGLVSHYGAIDSLARVHRPTGGRVVREWNPLAQRPYLSSFEAAPFTPPPDGPGDVDYAHWPSVCRDVCELGHELLHILAWEPVLAGDVALSDLGAEAFVTWSMAAEAACFHAGDQLYRHTALQVLGDERLRHASGGFHGLGHPTEILLAAGEPSAAHLDRLLDLFLLDARSLELPPTPAVTTLRRRVVQFAMRASEALQGWWHHLEATDALEAFGARFCQVSGLPRAHGLVPRGHGPDALRAYARSLPQLLEAPGPDPVALRRRRALQSRGWYAQQLSFAVDEGLVAGAPPTSPLADALHAALDAYAAALLLLPTCPADATLAQRSADRALQTVLRAHGDRHVAYRRLLLPDGDIDGIDLETLPSAGEPRHNDARWAWLSRSGLPWLQLALEAEAFPLLGPARDAADPSVRCAALDRLCEHPLVRRRWAVHLSDFDFVQGRFREPLIELI